MIKNIIEKYKTNKKDYNIIITLEMAIICGSAISLL
jgi:hypothetical protein